MAAGVFQIHVSGAKSPAQFREQAQLPAVPVDAAVLAREHERLPSLSDEACWSIGRHLAFAPFIHPAQHANASHHGSAAAIGLQRHHLQKRRRKLPHVAEPAVEEVEVSHSLRAHDRFRFVDRRRKLQRGNPAEDFLPEVSGFDGVVQDELTDAVKEAYLLLRSVGNRLVVLAQVPFRALVRAGHALSKNVGRFVEGVGERALQKRQ